MQLTFRDVFLKILEIIKYPNNKENLVSEMEKMNMEEALVNILDRFQPDVQEKIRNNPDEIKNLVTQNEYTEELKKVATNALLKFIDDITASLTQEQLDQIDNVLLSKGQ